MSGRECVVDRCSDIVHAKGRCRAHYRQHLSGEMVWFLVKRMDHRTLIARTCTKCGLLLDARWFGRRREAGRRGTMTRCKKCQRSSRRVETSRAYREANRGRWAVSSAESMRRFQDATRPTAINNRKEWTSRDLETLADPDLSLYEKALLLGRTYSAVTARAHLIGARSRTALGDPTRQEWVIRLATQDAP